MDMGRKSVTFGNAFRGGITLEAYRDDDEGMVRMVIAQGREEHTFFVVPRDLNSLIGTLTRMRDELHYGDLPESEVARITWKEAK